MKISLMFDVIEGHMENSAFMAQLLLKLVYEVKYEDFFNTHLKVIVTSLLLVLLVFGWDEDFDSEFNIKVIGNMS